MLFEIAINPKARFGPSEMEYEKLALLPLLVLRIIPKLPLFLFRNPNFIQISQKQSLKKNIILASEFLLIFWVKKQS